MQTLQDLAQRDDGLGELAQDALGRFERELVLDRLRRAVRVLAEAHAEDRDELGLVARMALRDLAKLEG